MAFTTDGQVCASSASVPDAATLLRRLDPVCRLGHSRGTTAQRSLSPWTLSRCFLGLPDSRHQLQPSCPTMMLFLLGSPPPSRFTQPFLALCCVSLCVQEEDQPPHQTPSLLLAAAHVNSPDVLAPPPLAWEQALVHVQQLCGQDGEPLPIPAASHGTQERRCDRVA